MDAAYRAKVREQVLPEGAFPEPVVGDPSPVRQELLRAAYDENTKVGKPPYAGVVIRTRGEVDWIMRVRGWRPNPTTREQTIDLRDVRISGVVLSGIDLSFANLSGAEINDSIFSDAVLTHTKLIDSRIHDTDFSRAKWTMANLSGIWMTGCTLTGTELQLSNLSSAIILNCTFTRTQMAFANLTGAGISGVKGFFFRDVHLGAANLSGAELLIGFKDSTGSVLNQARMDSATMLGDSGQHDDERFPFTNERTCLLDVGWNGAVLANVQWEQVHRLGDEAGIKEAKTPKDRVEARRDAARAYRGLAKALQAQGLADHALRYRERERQLERRAWRSNWRTIVPWAGSSLLNIVSGYGDKPLRSLGCYVSVIAFFMGVYWAITNQVFGFITSGSAHLAWYEALVLSIVSFHGRGFFQPTMTLGDPVALFAAAEAIIGLFIELVFIATFTQRFSLDEGKAGKGTAATLARLRSTSPPLV